MSNLDKVIVTDCDGVLMNWEYAFNVWMHQQGHTLAPKGETKYDMGDRYGLHPI